jgi:hypothetical protein
MRNGKESIGHALRDLRKGLTIPGFGSFDQVLLHRLSRRAPLECALHNCLTAWLVDLFNRALEAET